MDNPFKRMVVLPENEYNQLKYKQREEPAWPWDSSVEREQKLYALSLRRKREGDETTDPDSAKRDTSSIQADIDLFPATSRGRAQRLLTTLKAHSPTEIDWTKSGEVSFGPYSSTLPGSNMKDLIYHATAMKQRQAAPFGWHEFLQFLKTINAPVSMLNAETARAMGQPTAPAPKRRRRQPVLATKWHKL